MNWVTGALIFIAVSAVVVVVLGLLLGWFESAAPPVLRDGGEPTVTDLPAEPNRLPGTRAALIPTATLSIPEDLLVVPNPGPVENDRFGNFTVDGDWLAVSSWTAENGKGRVTTFKKVDGGWKQTQVLRGSDAAEHDNFGAALKLVGHTLYVTAPSARQHEGVLYKFELSGDKWIERELVIDPEGIQKTIAAAEQGYVFARHQSGFVRHHTDLDPAVVDCGLVKNVWTDGKTIAVTGPADTRWYDFDSCELLNKVDVPGDVIVPLGDNWVVSNIHEETLTVLSDEGVLLAHASIPGEDVDEHETTGFGTTLFVDEDKGYLYVSAPYHSTLKPDLVMGVGAVFTYEIQDNNILPLDLMFPPRADCEGTHFGMSVGVIDDKLVISAEGYNEGAGALFVRKE